MSGEGRRSRLGTDLRSLGHPDPVDRSLKGTGLCLRGSPGRPDLEASHSIVCLSLLSNPLIRLERPVKSSAADSWTVGQKSDLAVTT